MSTEPALPPTTIAGMDAGAIAGLKKILGEHPEFSADFLHARKLAREWKFNSFTEAGASIAGKPDIQEVFK